MFFFLFLTTKSRFTVKKTDRGRANTPLSVSVHSSLLSASVNRLRLALTETDNGLIKGCFN